MRKLLRALALSLIMVSAMSITSFADMTGENGKTIPSAAVNIPVRHTVTGDTYKGNEKFGFTLTADDAKCPMPEGSDGRSKTVTVSAGSKVDFGDITFEYPDAYYYTVSRVKADHKDFICSDETYSVLIVKLNDGSTQMVISSGSGVKPDEIVYADEYTAPSSGTPKTGDDADIFVKIAAFSAALLALIITVIARRKEALHEE